MSYEELPKFITFPATTAVPSTLWLHPSQLPASQTTNLCTATYHLAVLTMKTILQFIVHLTPAPHYHCIPCILTNHQPSLSIPYVMTYKKKKKDGYTETTKSLLFTGASIRPLWKWVDKLLHEQWCDYTICEHIEFLL